MKVKQFAHKQKRKLGQNLKRLIGWLYKIPYMFGFLPKQNIKMPDFIICGLPKTGTYWLLNVLRKHPDLEVVYQMENKRLGELRYFSIRFHHPISNYFRAFKESETLLNGVRKQLLFEKSPDYSKLSTFTLKFIRRLNPDIKMILCLREPVEFCFSRAKMNLVRSKSREFDDVPFSEFEDFYNKTATEYNYQKIVDRYLRIFSENVLFLNYKDINENPSRVLGQVCAFLNVAVYSEEDDLTRKVNMTKQVSIPKNHIQLLTKLQARNLDFYNDVFS